MRAAIFDLDGTLADTSGDLLNAANAVLAPEGLPVLSLATDKPYAGRGGREMIRRSLSLAGRDDGDPIVDRLYPLLLEAYAEALAVETRLYEGVERCLDALEEILFGVNGTTIIAQSLPRCVQHIPHRIGHQGTAVRRAQGLDGRMPQHAVNRRQHGPGWRSGICHRSYSLG